MTSLRELTPARPVVTSALPAVVLAAASLVVVGLVLSGPTWVLIAVPAAVFIAVFVVIGLVWPGHLASGRAPEVVEGAFAAPVLLTLPRSGSGKKTPPAMLIDGDADGTVTATFRQLRSMLSRLDDVQRATAQRSGLPRRADGVAPVVLVTATSEVGPDERLAAAANLALASASAMRPVALIDADLVYPGVTRLLGIGAEPGLADVGTSLGRRADGSPDLRPYLQPTIAPGLVAVAAGQPTGVPSDVLSQLSRFMTALATAGELVVVHGPPLDRLDDVIELLAYTDQLVVVAGPDATVEQATSVRRLVEQLHAPLAGVLLAPRHAATARWQPSLQAEASAVLTAAKAPHPSPPHPSSVETAPAGAASGTPMPVEAPPTAPLPASLPVDGAPSAPPASAAPIPAPSNPAPSTPAASGPSPSTPSAAPVVAPRAPAPAMSSPDPTPPTSVAAPSAPPSTPGATPAPAQPPGGARPAMPTAADVSTPAPATPPSADDRDAAAAVAPVAAGSPPAPPMANSSPPTVPAVPSVPEAVVEDGARPSPATPPPAPPATLDDAADDSAAKVWDELGELLDGPAPGPRTSGPISVDEALADTDRTDHEPTPSATPSISPVESGDGSSPVVQIIRSNAPTTADATDVEATDVEATDVEATDVEVADTAGGDSGADGSEDGALDGVATGPRPSDPPTPPALADLPPPAATTPPEAAQPVGVDGAGSDPVSDLVDLTIQLQRSSIDATVEQADETASGVADSPAADSPPAEAPPAEVDEHDADEEPEDEELIDLRAMVDAASMPLADEEDAATVTADRTVLDDARFDLLAELEDEDDLNRSRR